MLSSISSSADRQTPPPPPVFLWTRVDGSVLDHSSFILCAFLCANSFEPIHDKNCTAINPSFTPSHYLSSVHRCRVWIQKNLNNSAGSINYYAMDSCVRRKEVQKLTTSEGEEGNEGWLVGAHSTPLKYETNLRPIHLHRNQSFSGCGIPGQFIFMEHTRDKIQKCPLGRCFKITSKEPILPRLLLLSFLILHSTRIARFHPSAYSSPIPTNHPNHL